MLLYIGLVIGIVICGYMAYKESHWLAVMTERARQQRRKKE